MRKIDIFVVLKNWANDWYEHVMLELQLDCLLVETPIELSTSTISNAARFVFLPP